MGGIFISYRREDSGPYAGRLRDTLSRHFGAEQVFRDIDRINPGERFPRIVEREISSCDALLAVIGPSWLTIRDTRGRRRLDDPDDYVLHEITTALGRSELLVIPVLVGPTSMPAAAELPKPLAALAECNAVRISDENWDDQVARLTRALDKVVQRPVAPSTPGRDDEELRDPLAPRQQNIVRKLDLPRGVWSDYTLRSIDWQANYLHLIESEGEYTGNGYLTREALAGWIEELLREVAEETERARSPWRRYSNGNPTPEQLAETLNAARGLLRDMDEVHAAAIDVLPQELATFPDHLRAVATELFMKDDQQVDFEITQSVIDHARSRCSALPQRTKRQQAEKWEKLQHIDELANRLGFD